MNEVSLFRLYLLRAVYLFLAVGLAIFQWPDVIHQAIYQEEPWELMHGVVNCMQVTFGLLVILGIRYPLTMLPLLMWEMIWKSIWLLIVALPLWLSNQMDEATTATVFACVMGIVVPVAMPWRYVFAKYIRQPGDRWLNATGRGKIVGSQGETN